MANVKIGLASFFCGAKADIGVLAPCIITEKIVVGTHYIITLLKIVWDKFLVSHVTCTKAVIK